MSYELSVMRYESAAADSYFVSHISYLTFLISYFVFHLSHFKRISYFHMRRTCHVSRERHIRSYFIFRISYFVFRILYFVFRISYFSPLHTSLFLVHYSSYLCIKLQGMSNWILIFIVQLNRTGLFA